MKQYRTVEEVRADLGTQQQGSQMAYPEGNAARASMLGLGGQEAEGQEQGEAESGQEEEGPGVDAGDQGGQDQGVPQGPGSDQESGGEMEAQHGSHDHEDLGGNKEVTVGLHKLTTGQLNMLVDYVVDLDELAKISVDDLTAGFELIEAMEHGHLSAEQSEEFTRIFPNYAGIALDNSDHFAPPSSGLAPAGSENFLGQIREHFGKAYEQAKNGDVDGALATAGWGGHYVADAFSAGHMINKDEIMERAAGYFQTPGPMAPMVLGVAATQIHAEGNAVSRWRLKTPWGLQRLDPSVLFTMLQITNLAKKDAITGAVAKAAHDRLAGDEARIVQVSSRGLTWFLGGDGDLDGVSKWIASEIIAGVYEDLEAVSKDPKHISLGGMLAAVEADLPQPTFMGQALIDDVVENIFASPQSVAFALADSAIHEFDSIIAGFNDEAPERLGGIFVRVDQEEEGGDQISDYPTPDLREALEEEHLTDIDIDEVLRRLKGEDESKVLPDYGIDAEGLTASLQEEQAN